MIGNGALLNAGCRSGEVLAGGAEGRAFYEGEGPQMVVRIFVDLA